MPQTITPFDIASSLLADHPGLFVGERHYDFSIPEWVAENLKNFKEHGVKQLYMEMIYSEHQSLIEDYYNDLPNAETRLRGYLQKNWGQNENSPGAGQPYFEMIKGAKENGIHVYGVDIFYEPGTDKRFTNLGTVDEMMAARNHHWKTVIDAHTAELGNNEKYLVFGGALHSKYDPNAGGIDYLLGDIPSMDFIDSHKSSFLSHIFKRERPDIHQGNGIQNDYEISLPRSPNQREKGEKPAPQYRFILPPGIEIPEPSIQGPKAPADNQAATEALTSSLKSKMTFN